MIDHEIYDLMQKFDRSALTRLKLKTQDFTLELERQGQSSGMVPEPAPLSPAPEASEDPVISAPLVGTFYTAPAPDQVAFVSVGDSVKQGQTVCLLEAMKMMSEVAAPCDCIIEAVLKENGQLAAYGEPLFRYRPC